MREDAPVVPHGTMLRLHELREWHVVVAECWKCGHRAEVQQALLKRMRLLSMRLDDVSFRMKCTKCGQGGMQRLSVRKLPRNC
jgi:hypothetical protein